MALQKTEWREVEKREGWRENCVWGGTQLTTVFVLRKEILLGLNLNRLLNAKEEGGVVHLAPLATEVTQFDEQVKLDSLSLIFKHSSCSP